MRRVKRIRTVPSHTVPAAVSAAAVTAPDEIAAALRSSRTPPLPEVVSRVFTRLHAGQRVRLLRCLLRSVGPLAVSVVAAGAFVKCVARAGWRDVVVTVDDALGTTSAQVFELVRYVEQADPGVVDRVAAILTSDATVVAVLASTVAGVVSTAAAARLPRRRRPAR